MKVSEVIVYLYLLSFALASVYDVIACFCGWTMITPVCRKVNWDSGWLFATFYFGVGFHLFLLLPLRELFEAFLQFLIKR